MACMWKFDPRTGRCTDTSPTIPVRSRHAAAVESARTTDTVAASAAHDAAHGPPVQWARIPSGWKLERMMYLGPLTDAKIDEYAAQGRYSDGYRAMLREAIAAKKAERNNE